MSDPYDPHPADEPAPQMPAMSTGGLISERLAQQRQSERVLLLVVRLLFLVLLATVTMLTISSAGPDQFSITTIISVLISTTAVGVIVLAVDYLTPNKRLASVVSIYLGICVGLLGAVAIAKLIDVVAQAWGLVGQPRLVPTRTGETIEVFDPNPYLEMAKVIIGIVLCYLSISFVLTTKDDFRLVIPYVEFAKQVRGTRPLLLDTSVLIDGRIEAMVDAGFMDAPIVIPGFVVEELQTLSDSGDRLKRARGRRGLDLVTRLQANPRIDVSLEEFDVPGHAVDHKLVDLANMHQMRILTTDYNLVKVARINGASALNVNDLAAGLKPGVVPGESIQVEIVKVGENEGQGVGYLPDGTMIVVESASDRIGDIVDATVTNSLQTSAGRMIFAKHESRDFSPNGSDSSDDAEHRDAPRPSPDGDAHANAGEDASRAGRPRPASARNPRRG